MPLEIEEDKFEEIWGKLGAELTGGFQVDKGHWRDSVICRGQGRDKDDDLTVLAEWETRKFFDVHGQSSNYRSEAIA